jgi:hypothetical protein
MNCQFKFLCNKQIIGSIISDFEQIFNFEKLVIEFSVIAQVIMAFVVDYRGEVGFYRAAGINGIALFPKADKRILNNFAGRFKIFYILLRKETQSFEIGTK